MDVRWEGVNDVARQTWSTKACAAPTSIRTTRCARRSLADPRRQRKNTQGQHAGRRPLRARARRHGRRERRGQGRRLGEQVEVRDAQSVRLDRRLGAEDGADDGRRLVPAGHARHRHRRHRREGDAAGQGSADGRRSTCTSCRQRGPQNKIEELRIELYDKVNALGIGAQGLGGLSTVLDVKILDYPTHAASKPVAMIPELRRDAPRALHARRLRRRRSSSRPTSRDWPDVHWTPSPSRARVEPRHADAGRGRVVEAGRDAAAERQDAHRPRRRAQAHRRHARAGRAAAGATSRNRVIYYVGPVDPVRDEVVGPAGPDDRDAHGQVHRDDARARPA